MTPEYFQTFGVRLIKGRCFTDQDAASSVRVAMVNENFVRRFLPGVDPIGQRMAIDQFLGEQEWGPRWTGRSLAYFTTSGVSVRVTKTLPKSMCHLHKVRGRRRTSRSVPPATRPPSAGASRPWSIRWMLIWRWPTSRPWNRLQVRLSRLTASPACCTQALPSVALLLAAVGIYGVMAFAVAQRTHEIGLRMALGAGREQVLRLVLAEAMMLAVAGLGLGLVGACLVGRAMRSMLYGVGTVDLGAFAVVATALLTSAVFACYLPARRAGMWIPWWRCVMSEELT